MIKINQIKCLHCNAIVESTHVHHYSPCPCGKVAADGGKDYLRRTGLPNIDYQELSDYDKKEKD